MPKAISPKRGIYVNGDLMDVKLFVDGEEISLNEFVKKILSGAISGAITSLRDVDKGWREIRVEVLRT